MKCLLWETEKKAFENVCVRFVSFSERKSDFPELTPAMLNKLRHLTMVSLATKNKVSFKGKGLDKF